jgi:GT2 family glycosyltransferase
MLAYLHPDTVSHNFMQSVLGMLAYEEATERHLAEIVPARCPSGDLPRVRNSVVERFLTGEHEWLWFVDSDMGFYANTLENLLNVADPAERPVVGALCFAWADSGPDGLGGWNSQSVPTLFRWNGGTFSALVDYPRDTLVEVDATGAACLLIHRSVLTETTDWFTPMGDLGEDMSFCRRLNELKIPIHVHTSIPTSHHKSVWLKG